MTLKIYLRLAVCPTASEQDRVRNLNNTAVLFSRLRQPENLSLHFGNEEIVREEAGEPPTARSLN